MFKGRKLLNVRSGIFAIIATVSLQGCYSNPVMSEDDLNRFRVDCKNAEEQYRLMGYQSQLADEYIVSRRQKWLINQQLLNIRNQCLQGRF